MTAEELLTKENEIGEKLDCLSAESFSEAEKYITELLSENRAIFSSGRAESAALARLTCRVLLHRKAKDFLVPAIVGNKCLRCAFFGELNTYKYSLVYVLRRVLRAGNTQINDEICTLILENPFRDDSSKDYSERWSLDFIRRRVPAGQNDAQTLIEAMHLLFE